MGEAGNAGQELRSTRTQLGKRTGVTYRMHSRYSLSRKLEKRNGGWQERLMVKQRKSSGDDGLMSTHAEWSQPAGEMTGAGGR